MTALRQPDELILDRYLTHTDWARTPTNWIHFTNIGDWGNQVVERSSITEFSSTPTTRIGSVLSSVQGCQRQPARRTATRRGYVLTFPPGQHPEAMRFWSVTAYTPEAIELVDNPADKYAVASYTQGCNLTRTARCRFTWLSNSQRVCRWPIGCRYRPGHSTLCFAFTVRGEMSPTTLTSRPASRNVSLATGLCHASPWLGKRGRLCQLPSEADFRRGGLAERLYVRLRRALR